MRKLWLVMAVVILAAGLAGASDQTDVMKPVNQFVEGFNKGDIKMALATCMDWASIIDEFPPYAWHGAGAASNWASDYDADAKKNGITDPVVTLGQPKHIEVKDDHAYVVVPANYAYKQNGKPMKETGSTLTVALQQTAAGWRIVAWSWAKQ